jgi:uncharacterized protein (DUF433 family)
MASITAAKSPGGSSATSSRRCWTRGFTLAAIAENIAPSNRACQEGSFAGPRAVGPPAAAADRQPAPEWARANSEYVYENMERIEFDPAVMLGKPVIRGTRITVELILRKLAEGATEADLLDAYPRLERPDILAVLAYAAEMVAHETVLFPKTR